LILSLSTTTGFVDELTVASRLTVVKLIIAVAIVEFVVADCLYQ